MGVAAVPGAARPEEALPARSAGSPLAPTNKSLCYLDTGSPLALAAPDAGALDWQETAPHGLRRAGAAPAARLEREERTMRALVGLLAALVIGYFIYRLYLGQTLPQSEGGGSPVQAINTTGVKNDLIAIAQAERYYQAQHGNYATLDELVSSGTMNMIRSGREGYTYSVDVQGTGFTVNARYSGAISPPPPSFSVDQTMEIHAVP